MDRHRKINVQTTQYTSTWTNLGSDRQYLFKSVGSGLWEVQFLYGGDCMKREVVDKERKLLKKEVHKYEFMFFLSDQNRANSKILILKGLSTKAKRFCTQQRNLKQF
jgi:hypothetical protein